MTSSSRRFQGIDRSFKDLSITSSTKSKNNTKSSIADSWDDQASFSEDEDSTSTTSRPSTPLARASETPGPPPPTPSSPTHSRKKSTDWDSFPAAYSANPRSPTTMTSSSFGPSNSADKRPEKSSAAAGRMIAGALGVKAPKSTEEGRLYERAVRDNERKRREKAKEEGKREEREREEARRVVWDG